MLFSLIVVILSVTKIVITITIFLTIILFLLINPEGPCTQIVYTLGPMYLYRE